MNLNKMLAALMVATASLMVAPMATADPEVCPPADDDLTGSDGGTLTTAEPTYIWRLDDIAAGGEDLLLGFADEPDLGDDDLQFIVYEVVPVEEGLESCVPRTTGPEGASKTHADSEFALQAGKDYLVQVQRAATASTADLTYTIERA